MNAEPTRPSNPPLRVYLDHTEYSQHVRQLFERSRRDVVFIQARGPAPTVPAVEMSHLTLYGYDNIIRYVFPEAAEELADRLISRSGAAQS